MNAQEAAKLSALSRKQMLAKIDELAKRYRPAIIGYKEENGHQVAMVQAAYADGARSNQMIKSTGRSSGNYEL